MTTQSPSKSVSTPDTTKPVPGEPVLPDVNVNVVKPTAPVVGRVVDTHHATLGGKKSAAFIRHVAVDVSGTPLAGTFRAGQSFGVLPPGEDPKGKPHKLRLYSISSPSRGEDGQGNVLATCVKRVLDEHWDTHCLFRGVCSNYLCDLQEGDEVNVTGPSGKRFVLPEDPSKHDYVFLATGTGIAPFRSMVIDLLEGGFDSRVTLLMGSPYKTDLLYDDELRELDARHDNFRYLTAISREVQEDLPRRLYVQDRIKYDPAGTGAGSVTEQLGSERSLIYVCGLTGMELGIFRGLFDSLGREAAEQYVRVADDVADDPSSWNRKMINREIKTTRRVFLEVY
jgi:ferredoxin--NADP+ reductase